MKNGIDQWIFLGLPQLWTDPLGALGKTVVLVGLHAGLWHYERLIRR